jgi:hypothetical protein
MQKQAKEVGKVITNNNYSYPGESPYSYLLNLPVIIGFYFVIPIGLIIYGKVSGLIAGIIMLLFAIFFFVRRVVLRVVFLPDAIFIKHIGRSKCIGYNDIEKIYFNREGFAPWHVYVIKAKKNAGLKKVTFYCSTKEFDNLAVFLDEKGVTVDKKGKDMLAK